jgi:hypothetical protein
MLPYQMVLMGDDGWQVGTKRAYKFQTKTLPIGKIPTKREVAATRCTNQPQQSAKLTLDQIPLAFLL